MARQAFSSLPSSKRSRSTNRKQGRAGKRANFDALAIAEASTSDAPRFKKTRLGELEDEPQRGNDGGERSNKRRKIDAPTGEENESDESGSDSDGNRWHYGVNEDDEDSDIDSEEAFGDSDEDRYEGFTFRGSSKATAPKAAKSKRVSKKPARNLTLDEDDVDDDEDDQEDQEDEDDYDDDLGDEAVDLATALDMNEALEKEEEKAAKKKRSKKTSQKSTDSDGSEDDDEDEDEDEEDDGDSQSSIFSDAENDGAGDHSKLLDFVQDLNSQDAKSKSKGTRESSSYMFENPSEFGIKPTKKLTAADLLPTITDPRLRQSLKLLNGADKEEPKAQSKGIPGKLAVPLAKRQQDRLDRTAAYEKSKETLNRWIDTVKENRRAEHISFPLPNPDAQSALGLKQLIPTTSSTPITSLESAINNIMVESGLATTDQKSEDQMLRAFEELQEKKLPIEEVKARRAELRKARELMFREEIRAKRIKKIKSKAYRRVHRKEREKATEEERAALAAAGLLDSDDEREKNDRRRAEERMGARHRESKWAKSMKATGRGGWDEDARSAVNDMARRDDELRRRIEGKAAKDSDDDDDFSTESDSDDDVSLASDDETHHLHNKLKNLAGSEKDDGPGSRLNSLKFMQKAEAARKAANDAEIRQMRRELEGEITESGSDDEDEVTGRKTYGGRKQEPTKQSSNLDRNEFEAPMSDDEIDTPVSQHVPAPAAEKKISRADAIAKSLQSRPGRSQLSKAATTAEDDDFADNPWLSVKSKGKKQSSKDVVISASAAIGNPTPNGSAKIEKPQKSASKNNKKAVFADGSDSEDETEEAQGDQPTRNQELVRMAFAGDDVFEDFSKEKKETVLEEGDQVIDNALPGWGSWGGDGISKKAQKAQKRKAAQFKTTIKGVQADKRKDARLDRVIINEKKVKKNAKYLATELPHPFESRQQYERSLRLPLGPEWTTKNTFQDSTKPRVLIKQGIIRPMESPTV